MSQRRDTFVNLGVGNLPTNQHDAIVKDDGMFSISGQRVSRNFLQSLTDAASDVTYYSSFLNEIQPLFFVDACVK